MNKHKFVIIRKGKEIFNSTIEAPTYKIAYQCYLELLRDSQIEIRPFDYCMGKTLTNKN